MQYNFVSDKKIFQRKVILLSTIIASFLPLLILLFLDFPERGLSSEASRDFYITTVGGVIGLVGVQWIWWQVLLGFRGFIGKWIVDTVWMTKLHKFFGIYGFIIILLHPLLITSTYGLEILTTISLANDLDRYITLGRIAFAILLIIWVSSAVLRSKVSYRIWKYIHYSAYIILPLVFVHAFEIGASLNTYPWLQAYWNFLVISFFIFVFMRIASFFNANILKKKYTLVEKNKITHNVFEYIFSPLKQSIKPAPGQYAYLQIHNWGEEHPFTVAKYDSSNKNLSLVIKQSGFFSNNLPDKINVGDKVNIDGPYGIFTKEAYLEEQKAVLIAGGIGVTPFLHMCKHSPENVEALFYANRTLEDIAFKTDLESKVTVVHVLNKETNEEDGTFEKGYVTAELIEKNLPSDLSTYNFFVCGPPVMMDSIAKQLGEKGVAKSQIFMEKFSM